MNASYFLKIAMANESDEVSAAALIATLTCAVFILLPAAPVAVQ